ncbi:MAG TPA: methyltransferase domain-containing protein [Elusimicrobiota bacterium]|nr:methyltransferase domain-containing protein [Elusimicrobiota bacterium]
MPGTIRFEDGAAYERYMGKWSQSVAVRLLDWLAPPPGWRWLDVGCGNGAFTEILGERCAPGALHGIDPSDAQLAFARSRPVSRFARFTAGNAMALPFPEDRFDAAVMPLVISFVPRPATGVGEMARVVRPAGLVAAYIWDTAGGGFPYETLHNELRSRGVAVPRRARRLPERKFSAPCGRRRDSWTSKPVSLRFSGFLKISRITGKRFSERPAWARRWRGWGPRNSPGSTPVCGRNYRSNPTVV